MDLNKIKNVLIFAAHPDDEIIGCAGLILKLKKKNKNIKISIVICSDGSTGVTNSFKKKNLISIRKSESLLTAKKMKISDIIFLKNKSQAIKNDSENLRTFVQIIRKKKPDLILTHNFEDRNRDHISVYQLTMESIFKANENIMPDLGKSFYTKNAWSYEIYNLHKNPDIIVNIEKFINEKIKLIKYHKSQKENLKDIESNLLSLSKIRSFQKKFKNGEAYKILNSLQILI